ncbi:hypothetical protein CR513_01401, partial [Mucuna pruriens]
MQVGQLANTVSQLQSTGYGNLPFQTIPNSKGDVSTISLRSAMKHPTEDHSFFGIDVIDELVEKYMQLGIDNVEI